MAAAVRLHRIDRKPELSRNRAISFATPASTPKIIARRKGKDHGDMLRAGDAYMTAWFAYWLKGDAKAGAAFLGNNPELANNKNWQDVKISCKCQ